MQTRIIPIQRATFVCRWHEIGLDNWAYVATAWLAGCGSATDASSIAVPFGRRETGIVAHRSVQSDKAPFVKHAGHPPNEASLDRGMSLAVTGPASGDFVPFSCVGEAMSLPGFVKDPGLSPLENAAE